MASNGTAPDCIAVSGNCLLFAVMFTALGGRLRWCRNRRGRLHFYWLDCDGKAWEFAGPGAGDRTYLGNIFYRGTLRRAPSRDGA